jgi:hypothetical protein
MALNSALGKSNVQRIAVLDILNPVNGGETFF